MASKGIHRVLSNDIDEIEYIISVLWNGIEQFLHDFLDCLGVHGAINIDEIYYFWNVE